MGHESFAFQRYWNADIAQILKIEATYPLQSLQQYARVYAIC